MRPGIDYIGVGAGAIILNSHGEVFLARRGHAARNERFKWEFPGGRVEYGETISHALKREILEEFGFSISIIRLLDVVDHILPDEQQHWVSPTYVCKYSRGVPRILEPHKCEEIGWFSLNSIPRSSLSIASRKSLKSFLLHISAHEQSLLSTC